MDEIQLNMHPLQQLLDSFQSTVKNQLLPYGNTDTSPNEFEMPSYVIDRIMAPIKDCDCGPTCKCRKQGKCVCKSQVCLAKDCLGPLKKAWFQPAELYSSSLPTDITEYADRYSLHIDLPGATKEDIKVDCLPGHHLEHVHEHGERHHHHSDILSIECYRSFEASESQGVPLRKERPFGSVVRQWILPDDVDLEGVASTFKDGVLTIQVPRVEKPPAKSISVQIG